MILWARFFIVVAMVFAVIGYGEMVGIASLFAKILFFIFTALYVILLLKIGVVRKV
ncbi:DUF1328 domain-containing protein [Subsaxibacter sp. CAU 1640]|uniref:DUF1328 domain-containing protein n=1 Tax=Subsaxibacter sp. CAU 1640 TaxID=2933271 RepID=UPI0020035B2C|nr:DUF1328 family protein [Subsaxibacter sp. CAU 1640]MCK7591809.1 DUF1328 domain-containing protein [Subsaxibacter sp. CAU 1640]